MKDFSLLLKYKICYLQQSSLIDTYLSSRYSKEDLYKKTTSEIIYELASFGFITLFGFNLNNRDNLLNKYLLLVPNSKILQIKWARENNFKYNKNNWQKEILAAQIEKFQPDVIYTGNYVLFDQEMREYLPKARLYALWNASPIQEKINLSHFDIGVSFNEVYHKQLRERGIEHIEYNSFYINPEINNKLESMKLEQDIDISFSGRYSPMFKTRNQFLYDIYSEFKKEYNIQYYLLSESRVKGLIPTFPWKLFGAYNKPVFLEDMFKVFKRSKIVLNTHSNITGEDKGNMRVYEALGSRSFMLSDEGIYPEHLKAGEDFIVYKNKKDMLDKIGYYLKNNKEREEIAINGHKKIAQFYSTEIGSKNLENIFRKYI